MQVGALEADDELREDPCFHVLAPYNVPMRIRHGVDGAVVGVAAGLRLGGPGGDSLRTAHQYAAQHDVCLAGLVCLGQQRADQTKSMTIVSFLVIGWGEKLGYCPMLMSKRSTEIYYHCSYEMLLQTDCIYLSIFHDCCRKYTSICTLVFVYSHIRIIRLATSIFFSWNQFLRDTRQLDFPKWAKGKEEENHS
jgi:hypothetical protein